jgi:hypothetical protein
MKTISNFYRILAFAFPISLCASKLPNYSPDSLVFRIDKSKPYYSIDTMTQNEKKYSKEFRDVHLSGTVFPDEIKVLIAPQLIIDPKTPFEATANFLFAANSQRLDRVIALHDSTSKRWVDSCLHEKPDSVAYFSVYGKLEQLQVKAIFETPDVTIIYEKYLKGKESRLRPMFFVKENGVYKKKSGAINISFMLNLWSALQKSDSLAIIKK